MNKFILSCLITVLLFIVPLAVFFTPDRGNLEIERRQIAAFPDFPSKLRSRYVKKYFHRIDEFFADHFPLRTSLLMLSMELHEVAGDSLDTDKCYRGKENWLFLGNSYAHCVDKLQGSVTLSSDSLKCQTKEYEEIHDAAKNCGAEFFIFIGPNKSSIYPEYLPPVIVPGQRRFIVPLLDTLNDAGINVYDPTARLIAKKNEGLLYYRTDTHWNAKGAYEAFEGFRKWAVLPPLPPFSLTGVSPHYGDLVNLGGYKKFPLSAGDAFALEWDISPDLHKEGSFTTNAEAVSDKKAWIFGDSFAEALEPYLTATFKEVHFFKHGDFQTVVSSQLPKPDFILWIIVERNFAKVE